MFCNLPVQFHLVSVARRDGGRRSVPGQSGYGMSNRIGLLIRFGLGQIFLDAPLVFGAVCTSNLGWQKAIFR
jgi:hypothetical protein